MPAKGQFGFSKGDPHINRKGRAPAFDFIRSLAQQIASEVDPVLKKTNAEVALRQLLKDDPMKFIEIAYGKVPDKLTITGDPDLKLVVEIVKVTQ